MSTTAIILAAGQGTRMKSSLPKVLHPVCGRPKVVREQQRRVAVEFRGLFGCFGAFEHDPGTNGNVNVKASGPAARFQAAGSGFCPPDCVFSPRVLTGTAR